jgi:hypothetical protein
LVSVGAARGRQTTLWSEAGQEPGKEQYHEIVSMYFFLVSAPFHLHFLSFSL